MQNISKFILTFFIAIPLVFAFGNQTVKQIDEIKNNTGTDILLNPTDKVDIGYFTGEKALQSTVDGELEESAVTNTELGYVSGVTSSIQTQLDSKAIELRNINTTTPLQGGGTLEADRTLSILQSGIAQDGYLSSVDWNTFNAKSDYIDPATTDGDLVYYNSGIDRLGIGSNGQVLQVSALGFPEWADLVAVSVTTKGDIQTYSTVPDRLAVGTDSQILSANSATSTGLEWIDLPVSSPITTQGDISIGDVSGNPVRLPIGAVDQILVSDGSTLSYQDIPVSLPDQTGNTGKYLYTTGSTALWRNSQIDDNNTKDNLLECSGFDGCAQEGTITNGAGIDLSGTTTRTVEASAWNTSKLNLTQSAVGTLDYTYTKTADYDGKQMMAYCEIKTANTGVTFNSMKDGVVQSTLSVSSDNSWKYYKIPFVGGATSQGFKVDHVTATEIPDIDIDNCFIGKDANQIREIGQAHFVGSARAERNSDLNCQYLNTLSATKQQPDQTGCPSLLTTTGGLSLSSSSSVPSFNMDVISGTVYKINIRDMVYKSNASGLACETFVSIDGGTTFEKMHATWSTSASANQNQSFTGSTYTFTASATGSLNIDYYVESFTAGHCEFMNRLAPWVLDVYAYPDANSTVVTQDTELTAKTANELTYQVNFLGNLISSNYTGWVSTARISQGIFTYDYSALGLSEVPLLTCQPVDSATSNTYDICTVTAASTTSATVSISRNTNGSKTYRDTGHNIVLSKQGADVNKSQTIVGKFENVEELNVELSEEEINTLHIQMNYVVGGNPTIVADQFSMIDSVGFSNPFAIVRVKKSLYTEAPIMQCGLDNGFNSDDNELCARNSASDTATGYAYRFFSYRASSGYISRSFNFRFTRNGADYNKDLRGVIINASDYKTLCATKEFTAGSTTTIGVIADMTFNNLEIGKKYKVYSQMYGDTFTASADMSFATKHNGSTINLLNQVNTTGVNGSRVINSNETYFTATATTVIHELTDCSNCVLRGTYTRATLCELPETTIINSTKFD